MNLYNSALSVSKILFLLWGILVLGVTRGAYNSKMLPSEAIKVLELDPAKEGGYSAREIKKAYRKLAKKFHPDSHPNVSLEEKQKWEEKFKKVLTAYETLGEGRRDYHSFANSENLFNNFANYTEPQSYSNASSFSEEIKAAKEELTKLWENTTKEYEEEVQRMETQFFQVPIIDHAVLKNKEWYGDSFAGTIVEKYLGKIKVSMQKIRDSIEVDRRYYQYYLNQINNFDAYSSKKNIADAMQDCLTILQHKSKHYLAPLVEACQKELDYLKSEIQGLPAINTVNPVLQSSIKEMIGGMLKNILAPYEECLLICYQHSSLSDFDQAPSSLSSNDIFNYVGRLNHVKKAWKKIHEKIPTKIAILKKLVQTSQALGSSIEEEIRDYQLELPNIQVTIGKMSVPNDLVAHIKESKRQYKSHQRSSRSYYSSTSTSYYFIKNSLIKINKSIENIGESVQLGGLFYNPRRPFRAAGDINVTTLKKKVERNMTALKNKNYYYLIPLQKAFEKTVTLFTEQRNALPSVDTLPEENRDKWLQEIWRKESALISNLLEIYAYALEQVPIYDFGGSRTNYRSFLFDLHNSFYGSIPRLEAYYYP